ncbi:Pilus assembly protein [Bordetella sputigena]|uniref:hypothetical protein n=1 Tax=Bordetella sputigena TaxID=1416810 RepID=UPI0039EFEAD7
MGNKAQHGQAMVEAVAGLAVLGLLATAVLSVARFQWQGLWASHAARTQAFRYALGDRAGDVAAPGSSSSSLSRGGAVHAAAPLPRYGGANVQVMRAARAADFVGPGGPRAAALRRELGAEDQGMVHALASVRVSPHPHHGTGLIVRRHAAILADAGHADSDSAVQRRIGASRAAWAEAARGSLTPARQAQALLKRIDTGWRRPPPDLDWLGPWSDLVPADRLHRAGTGTAGWRP